MNPIDPATALAAVAAHLPRGSEVISVREIAARLGLDRKTVYAAAERGELPARRLGRKWIIARVAFEAWLAARGA